MGKSDNSTSENSGSNRIGSADELGVDPGAVQAFFREHYSRIALGNADYYRWQFQTPPECDGRDGCCVVVDEQGKIAGVMGLNPRRFYLNSKDLLGAELTSWIIDPAMQGRGLGVRMLKYLQKSYEVLLGTGISQAALPVYMGMGFRYSTSIPRFFKVFDANKAEPFIKMDRLGARLLRNRSRIKPQEPRLVEPVDGDRITTCEASLLKNGLSFYRRTPQHLRWRYDRHPFFQYETAFVQNQGAGVIVALRLDTIEDLVIMHVIDLFGDPVDIPSAIGHIERRCQEESAVAVDFYCITTAVSRFFIDTGWFSTLDEPWLKMVNLFHPPEWRDPQTTSLIYWARDNMVDLADLSRLLLTKQDLDLDRPTMSYINTLK